jgi:acyl-CoA reductase-like NAD-dependent aldehyde dehydrogenase
VGSPVTSHGLTLCSDCCLQVAPIAVRGALQSSGQNCAGAERFYVQEPVYEKFVKEVSSIVKSVRMVSFANSLLSWVL